MAPRAVRQRPGCYQLNDIAVLCVLSPDRLLCDPYAVHLVAFTLMVFWHITPLATDVDAVIVVIIVRHTIVVVVS